VKCWGYNAYGQVGNGTSAPTPSGDVLIPTDVVGLTTGVIAIAPGGYHSCALLEAGGAVCWGKGGSGQLGDGTTTYRNEPVAVSTPPGISFSSIAAGEYHTCAVTSQGGTMCWGDNVSGGLGLGDEADRWVPTDVPGLSSNTASLDAGRWSTCRVDTAGRTSCWGWNLYGQAGNGYTSVSVSRPAAVAWFAPRFSTDCSGLACTFTDTSVDPDREVVGRGWSFGEGGTAVGASVARTYPSGGTYLVALTLVDATGTSVASQRSVTLTPWGLVATVTKARNVTTVRLTWNATATSSPTVDVVRGGTQRTTVANTGSFSQAVSKGTFTFVVCPTGDARCSNSVTVKV
jgi:hypothetical protein